MLTRDAVKTSNLYVLVYCVNCIYEALLSIECLTLWLVLCFCS